MGFSVFMNIAGGIFAITAIVLYGMDLRDTSLLWICDRSSDDAVLDEDNCRNVALFAQVIQPTLQCTITAAKLSCELLWQCYMTIFEVNCVFSLFCCVLKSSEITEILGHHTDHPGSSSAGCQYSLCYLGHQSSVSTGWQRCRGTVATSHGRDHPDPSRKWKLTSWTYECMSCTFTSVSLNSSRKYWQ